MYVYIMIAGDASDCGWGDYDDEDDTRFHFHTSCTFIESVRDRILRARSYRARQTACETMTTCAHQPNVQTPNVCVVCSRVIDDYGKAMMLLLSDDDFGLCVCDSCAS